ncbi:hypothetical protein GCM10009525_69550 [Streptosporangium amethystogenes subsp. fukuiense]
MPSVGKSESPIPGAPGLALVSAAELDRGEAEGPDSVEFTVELTVEPAAGALSPLDAAQATVPMVPSVLSRAAVAVVASRLDAIPLTPLPRPAEPSSCMAHYATDLRRSGVYDKRSGRDVVHGLLA